VRTCVLAHVCVRARVRLRRYELERGLLEGSVAVADLPRLWNEKMAAYLGCTPEDDGEGVLQARPVCLIARLRVLCGRRLAGAKQARLRPAPARLVGASVSAALLLGKTHRRRCFCAGNSIQLSNCLLQGSATLQCRP